MQATELMNGIDTDALRKMVDEVSNDPARGIAGFEIATRWTGGTRTESRVDGWRLGGQALKKNFTIVIDEPPELLGENTAPNPQEYLLAAVNACILATFVAVSAISGVALERLEIRTRGDLDLRGFLGLDPNVKPGYDRIEYTIRVRSSAPRAKLDAIHKRVMATSPNFWNMANPIRMEAALEII